MAFCLLGGGSIALATDVPEGEPNNSKIQATATTNVPGWGISGDTISGATTGASTSSGANSLDMFFIQLEPLATNIYRHRLVLTTSGPTGHTAAIMGLPDSGIPTETTTAQVSATTTSPPRFNQWYGFGRAEKLYYRVTGTPSTTEPYTATLQTTVVNPVAVGTYQAGRIVISTRGRGHSTNTEMFLYDAGLNLLRWNEDSPTPATDVQSEIAVELEAGVYYLALSTSSTAIGEARDAFDRATTGTRLDFPGALVRESSTTANVNVAFSITDAIGASPRAASLTGPYEVYWATFTVSGVTGACCFEETCDLRTAAACASAGGQFQGDGTSCNIVATYTANPDVEIPDEGEILNFLTVPDSRLIRDLNVGLLISHSFQGDIIASLTSPAGTTVDLLTRPGQRSDDFGFGANDLGDVSNGTDFVVDDEAAFFYELGAAGAPSASVTGTWRADRGPLADFVGEDAQGVWTLTVSDNAPADTGRLVRWKLFVAYADPEACGTTDPCAAQTIGDANCDGLVNNFDINCFVFAIAEGESGWAASCNVAGNCDFSCVLDINGDGSVNNFDIDPFVLCLTEGCP
ncbi:MAG: proprotein convertase P-domain-containing protein [Phycisphaerales bacterium]|nr:proprotein convertase P-domain-containing protein [Phycisphaerales bacterium]